MIEGVDAEKLALDVSDVQVKRHLLEMLQKGRERRTKFHMIHGQTPFVAEASYKTHSKHLLFQIGKVYL